MLLRVSTNLLINPRILLKLIKIQKVKTTKELLIKILGFYTILLKMCMYSFCIRFYWNKIWFNPEYKKIFFLDARILFVVDYTAIIFGLFLYSASLYGWFSKKKSSDFIVCLFAVFRMCISMYIYLVIENRTADLLNKRWNLKLFETIILRLKTLWGFCFIFSPKHLGRVLL